MSIKVSVYIATSLNGFIARNDGGLDGLNEANDIVPDGEDGGFNTFMDSVNTIIMCRKT
jgi:dihydrofolate reductase